VLAVGRESSALGNVADMSAQQSLFFKKLHDGIFQPDAGSRSRFCRARIMVAKRCRQ
jgi:hypothetical protein